ncbi:energy-coupled thiamine transporter ThiT [Paenisporosarcina cavernae]|uniref:Energy-coupled thiamine transporter ThiT n=1 Tax=Paenisporosarcina cavernae TaxID=2320858 RepID=A0A385YVF3_9BACL|nr:energy-coupled thiamine transporter ThiT [Paenisporosarcina cavernae]AYC30260.1 energy-coupled thiamine transporter ThiT [Paenisporosarcina cavernae]
MRNKKLVWMVEIAIFAALAFALDFVKWSMPQGGAVSLAMIPIVIMAFRRGIGAGMATGALFGLLQIVTGMMSITPLSFEFVILQVVLEYIVAFMVIGLAGVMKNRFDEGFEEGSKGKMIGAVIVGVIFAGAIRYVIHVIAGYFFWGMYAEGNALIYSAVYNATYMIPLVLLTGIVCGLLFAAAPRLLEAKTA